jgi:uncharacterized protein (DUF2252 family)
MRPRKVNGAATARVTPMVREKEIEPAPAGKDVRQACPRSSHAAWSAPPDREDPVAVLARDDVGRLPQLLPIRYGRMRVSPFTFYRGAASIMARDLATTPISGFHTQLCGDAHLLNFGVNDFDETLPGPWEWDLKRLATSVVVAGRHLELRRPFIGKAVRACVRSYRDHMAEYANMPVLDVWYARLDQDQLLDIVRSASERRAATASLSNVAAHASPKVAPSALAPHAIVDRAPLIFHPEDNDAFRADVRDIFTRYRATLRPECRSLFDRFELADAAYKVVGVGSVGTRCLIALFAAGDDTLLLQAKEARRSALAPYLGAAEETEEGQRVVNGQRAMQAVSDIFLGWTRDDENHDYYIRQAHDMKTSANVDRMDFEALRRYVSLCGWALARAHAKAGGCASEISGYLGRGERFIVALADFAEAYADQNELDYAKLIAAIEDGRVVAEATPQV